MEKPVVNCEFQAPGLPVEDITAAVDFYTNKLGFNLNFLWGDPPTFAAVMLGKVEVHLYTGKPAPHICSVYFIIDDIEELYEYHRSNGVEILEEPRDQIYSLRDYRVADLYGNILGFGHYIQ